MTDSSRSPSTRSTKEIVQLSVGAVLLVLLVLFVAANTDKTKISFLVGDVDLPLILVLVITAALGAAIAELFRYQRGRKR